MKTKILFIVAVMLAFVSCKKDVNSTDNPGSVNIIPASAVPSAVIAAFSSSFSGATETEWHQGSDDSYTCQFNMDDKRHEARFEDNGHQSSHSVICLDGAVPNGVLNAFRSVYPNDNVYEWKLTNENTWKAHFMRGSVKWEVTFNNSGSILETEHD
ncbi:hypothetical protein I5907_16440 [Panacibacter sp. DH6]|uniref:Beta-lactamase-inhibitor-like PepSY-like domain-containing protein n=1 Tax=Panacibacter microcysteis TaxID=2793269 RepID=A0A931GWL9_9BACT|nr:hypothetical protein [Panacibacter microcysteis]MBG9377830.1 hypothetical protein [Panacibacter microcysteis]